MRGRCAAFPRRAPLPNGFRNRLLNVIKHWNPPTPVSAQARRAFHASVLGLSKGKLILRPNIELIRNRRDRIFVDLRSLCAPVGLSHACITVTMKSRGTTNAMWAASSGVAAHPAARRCDRARASADLEGRHGPLAGAPRSWPHLRGKRAHTNERWCVILSWPLPGGRPGKHRCLGRPQKLLAQRLALRRKPI